MYILYIEKIVTIHTQKDNDFSNCHFDIANIAKYIYTESANEINFTKKYIELDVTF